MSFPESFFNPAAIAVVGASADRRKVGNVVCRNLLASGYPGKIFPVNPKGGRIEGLPAYASVTLLPEAADLAVVAVPAAAVLPVLEEIGAREIPNVVVLTAGFRETGPQGAALEREVLDVARRRGMRLLGPNCLGFMDTGTPLNASFAAHTPLPGPTAFFSQSGAMCAAILDWSLEERFGFSRFVSLGNQGDLAESDFLAAAGEDPGTKVVLLYLESVKDGPRFLRTAQEVSRKKPVVVYKSGTSVAGARAAASHTGALAGADRVYDAAFQRAGILRARTVEELFTLARVLSSQPSPRGHRVAVVTNSGGPGVITADAIERQGLELARFSKETHDFFRRNLPAEANVENPIDLVGDADAVRYDLALTRLLATMEAELLLVILTPTAVIDPQAVARVLRDRLRGASLPAAVVLMGGVSLPAARTLLEEAGLPVFSFPEPAVAALAALVAQRKRIGRPLRSPYSPTGEKARSLAGTVLGERRGSPTLDSDRAAEVLAAYGIPTAPLFLCHTTAEAAAAAADIGSAVAMKVFSHRIVHKTDIGGVRLGLEGPEEVGRAFREIRENLRHFLPETPFEGIVVQKMFPQGTELILGSSRDPRFGPLLMVGWGGTYANLLEDVSFRLAEGLDEEEVREMLGEIKAHTLLEGYRGSPALDRDGVIEAILKLSRLVLDFPQILELDINPLAVYPDGVWALDVKLVVAN